MSGKGFRNVTNPGRRDEDLVSGLSSNLPGQRGPSSGDPVTPSTGRVAEGEGRPTALGPTPLKGHGPLLVLTFPLVQVDGSGTDGILKVPEEVPEGEWILFRKLGSEPGTPGD